MTDELSDLKIDPRLERAVWKSLGLKSVRQIAQETGLEPEQIFAIKRELLDAVDVLSVNERKMKILVALETLAQDALDRAANASDEFSAGHFNAARGAMKDMLTELNRASKGEQEAIDRLNDLRIRELTSLLFEVVDSTVPLVAERYGLNQDELFEMFNESLNRAAARRDALPR